MDKAQLEKFIQNDRIFNLFHMEILEATTGFARVKATVKEKFLNAHDIAHGALIFALTDVAFALSVNSITDAVGIQWSFNILRAAQKDETIIAEARVIHSGQRSLVVDFKAENGHTGKIIARGMATAMPLPKRSKEEKS